MKTKEKIGYVLMLLIMLACLIFLIIYTISGIERINELLNQGEYVKAEVIRVEEQENLIYAPIFRFQLSDGSILEHENQLFYGDLYAIGDKVDYIYYIEKPQYSMPTSFLRFYGVLIGAVFACLFCLSFIVILSLKLLNISYVNNLVYGLVLSLTLLLATIILGTLTTYEIKRTNTLLDTGIQTTAEVIRIDKKKRNGKKAAEFPVFKFSNAEGLTKEVSQNWSGLGKLKVGDAVDIIYNPTYSNIARRNNFWYIHGVSLLFSFLTLVFFVGSFYVLKRLLRK